MRHGPVMCFSVGVEGGCVVDGAGIGHGVYKNAGLTILMEVLLVGGKDEVQDREHMLCSLVETGKHGFGDGREDDDLGCVGI